MVGIKVNSTAIKKLEKLKQRADTIPYQRIGNLVKRSVNRNFAVGGRPKKWPERKDNLSHPLLVKSGKLKNSIYVEANDDSVSVGSRVAYQAVHNYGYPPRNIPQREYLIVQKSDEREIRKMIKRHLLK